jgi:hypothetical protein
MYWYRLQIKWDYKRNAITKRLHTPTRLLGVTSQNEDSFSTGASSDIDREQKGDVSGAGDQSGQKLPVFNPIHPYCCVQIDDCQRRPSLH